MESTSRVRRLLLCAAGGYQSFMLPAFILSLLKHVADDVQVVLSKSAAKLVSKHAVETASRHTVFIEMEDTGPEAFVPHIELPRAADLVLVYPASVNIIGKVANGITDELISALIIATDKPVIFVPIANHLMWEQPAVARNLETLRKDGYVVLPPQPNVEIATREGLEEITGPFPMPTLQLHLKAAMREGAAGAARRVPAPL
jgi:phosphopantothenoylcysteine synthetase/decarboxylase